VTAADESQVAAILRRYSDDYALIKNKDSLMLLAKGVDKESGARAALAELDVSPDQAIAVGDAENDLALFRACGKTAAVANAVPELKAAADLVLDGEHATGVVELIELVLDGKF
jgi:hydroxymethylpyrimidine pyrophosphatase-like HAD family hydrolase